MRRLFVLVLLAVAPAAFAGEELRLVLERKSLTATWRTYHQFIDGVEVVGSAVIERVDGNGSVHETTRSLATLRGGQALLPVLGRGDRQETETFVYLNLDGEARPAYRTITQDRVAHYVDAATGAEIRREPLYWNVKARVFDPNPVAKLNDPTLRDRNDTATAVPESAYSIVDLPDDLVPSGVLIGPNVAIVDTEQPYTVHADAAQPLLFNRSQPQFEEVNAYFHIDRSQRYMQSLGFRGERRLVNYAIPVDPHAANGTDNSYYIGGLASGMGSLSFGDGGTDDAEDSDIMLHEFGHAIQDWIAPGAFGGPPPEQARALGEGFGDYWGFSQNYMQTVAGGRDPFCIADWDARCFEDDPGQGCAYASGADCLRRVDSVKTMANYLFSDTPGTEHRNGEIWSSALREFFMALVQQNGAEQGRRIADATVLEGTFGVPPNPTFNLMARKLLDADRALWGGAHAATICAAMTKRGIIAAGDCGVLPRGELTLFQSGIHGVPIPDGSGEIAATALVTDARPIDKLLVRVDIEHPSRGELKISLVSPDGTTLLLQDQSLDRGADVHATFGSDIQPVDSLAAFNGKSIAGVWKLVVSDTRRGDAGRLLSWALVVKFAGDEPGALRPFAQTTRLHIPVVARTAGLGGTTWRSDLFLYNRGSAEATVTIVYTPSGSDGATSFGAVKSVVAAKQLVAFRNVVAQLFGPGGSGTLELQGNVSQLVAWSATYDVSSGGTIGQSIDAIRSTDAAGLGDGSLWLNALVSGDAARTNVGVVETAGESGTVSIALYDPISRAVLDTRTISVTPFTHLQIPLPPLRDNGPKYAEVRVSSGDARVIAYASVIGAASRDPMYVPARRAAAQRREVIPAAAMIPGAFGTAWATDLWIDNVLPAAEQVFTPPVPITYFASTPAQFKGITRPGFGSSYLANFVSTLGGFANTTGQIELDLPRGVLATSFLYSVGQALLPVSRRGDTILPIAVSEAVGEGEAVDAIRIENDAAFRTNVGVTEVAGAPATLRITLVDASGNEIASTVQDIGPRGRIQFGVGALAPRDVVDARIHVEVLSGPGRVFAYASVVDNASQDAYFVRAR